MGIFNSKKVCSVCNSNLGLSKFQIANKEWLCSNCYSKCGFTVLTPMKNMSVSDIQEAIRQNEINKQYQQNFNVTKKVGGFLEIDENKQQWLIIDGFLGKKSNPKIYNYTDIIDFELLEDGEMISKGGIGRAVAGGLLFGGVGAIVGGVTGHKKTKSICKSLKIKITINNLANPVIYIKLLTTDTKKDSFTYKSIYKFAQECLSVLQYMCNYNEQDSNRARENMSVADEINKFKQLLDNQVITEQEFETKKKQLLSL